MTDFEKPHTPHEFKGFVFDVEDNYGYERPDAFAFGIATIETDEPGSERVLDVKYTRTNYETNYGTAAVLAHALDLDEEGGLATGEYRLGMEELEDIYEYFEAFHDEAGHGNVETIGKLQRLRDAVGSHPSESMKDRQLKNRRVPILGVVRNWEDEPESVADAYLRLYALSERHREPNTVNLDGIFTHLPNVAVSEQLGTYSPERWREVSEDIAISGLSTAVRVLDKFPRMTDHVVPSGVRIADPSRVRLGAHLGEGTTVMHEGFSNFNAGTLGASMVEGRISAGVVVGEGSDVGGGASIMGTLSGGGKEKISIGERSLLEANSGIGISLGDDCRVEAGTYVKSTTPVKMPNGNIVKAHILSGSHNMNLRRNAQTGEVELLPNVGGEWGGLSDELHSNQ